MEAETYQQWKIKSIFKNVKESKWLLEIQFVDQQDQVEKT